MKITSILCSEDHAELVPTEFTNLSPAGDRNTRIGFSCTEPGCNICFSAIFGYFTIDENGKIDTKSPSKRCALGHEPSWSVLTRIDGEFKWACPEPNCEFAIKEER